MPVPNSMVDLATLASSNFPTGTESIGNSLDNYIRALSAIIRSTNAVASSTLASASTTDIASADGESVNITGTATINSLGSGFPGCFRELRFSASCIVVSSGNIIIPGSTNITTNAFDTLCFRCVGTGVWILVGGGNVRRTGDSIPGSLSSAGTITGDSGGTGLAPAISVGNDASFWDVNTANSVTLRGASDSGRGYMYFGNAKLYGVGVDPTSNALNLRTSSLTQLDTGGAGALYYEYLNCQHFAQYKQSGAFGWYWRKNSNGTPTGTSEVGLATLDDNGNFTVAGNLLSLSDESVKTNWRDLPGDFVEAMAGVKFGVYDRIDSGETQAGVSAQSWEAVLPETVHLGEDGKKSVVYGNAALVGVIALSQRLLKVEREMRRKGKGASK